MAVDAVGAGGDHIHKPAGRFVWGNRIRLQLREAHRTPSRTLGASEGRQQQCGDDADDGND